MRQFGQNGMDAPESFGEAGENMQGAQGSLRQGDREGALGEQGQALDNLRRGAQSLAQQMMQQGQGQQGSQGRTGEARGDTRSAGPTDAAAQRGLWPGQGHAAVGTGHPPRPRDP